MKLLVALCVMAVGVSAQYGESGVIYPDGTLRQLTPEEAANVAEIGESGVVFKDGTHTQFDLDFAALHNNLPAPARPEEVTFGPYGYHGIIKPDGNNVQFSHAQHSNVVLVGPSGVITADGKNLQLDQDGLPLPLRRKRAVSLEGPSGVLFADGQKRHLPVGVTVVSVGPSGATLSNGKHVQFREKRAVSLEGPSGVLFADGQKRHLPVGVTVVSVGPSGATLSNGKHVQFREKRAASGAVVGSAGFITPSGVPVQLAPGVTVASSGPSGIVLSTGENVQYDRKKRSASGAVVGSAGFITPSGVPVQLAPGVTVASSGPSGIVLSTGENVQYDRRKRAAPSKATVGESGIITPGGRLIQFPHDVSVVLAGPSAAILSNGDIGQYEF
uniref:Cuticle proprotein proCP6 n=1 Tax=Callinectes sapidus TaxID=6763 RepID=A6YPV5_CALSI|nr:cuticle proprotein proCP6 [Callinectes sapidus]